MAEWQYAVVLHRFRVEGDSEAAQAALDRASSANAPVLRCLANDTPLPAGEGPSSYGLHRVEQAHSYLRYGLKNWQQTPGAIEWVKRVWAETHPPAPPRTQEALVSATAPLLALFEAWQEDFPPAHGGRYTSPVALTTSLTGAGGFGKTTLAQALCHDARVRAAFPDGILWVTLGERPGDLIGRINGLSQAHRRTCPPERPAPGCGAPGRTPR